MVFSSLVFLSVFLPMVFLLHQAFPRMAAKNALLLVASLLFYSYGEPVYVLLMIASTLCNWLAGLAIGRRSHRRLFLAMAVVGNLGILGIFKYADMFIDGANMFLGMSIAPLGIALPIGISFFTFQALSYVIDVYRGEVAAEKNFAVVLLYVSFFPQLIAGPIVKYHDIAQELRNRSTTPEGVALGLRRFCVGLAKKVLIANAMAVAADYYFSDPTRLNALAAWMAAIAYMLQIYFDFSGYSDMAIGLGHMFGFHFKENFNYPYVATSIQEFWHRWHISLSTWFKEYLYIPLGGNRRGHARTMLNKLTVFVLCGLWHGASWTFVLWGLIHGGFLMLEQVVPVKKLPRWLRHLYCLLVVCLAFVLFRADTLAQAGEVISHMLWTWDFSPAAMLVFMTPLTPMFLGSLVLGLAFSAPVTQWMSHLIEAKTSKVQSAWQIASYGGALVLMVFSITVLSSGAYNPFIYFRF